MRGMAALSLLTGRWVSLFVRLILHWNISMMAEDMVVSPTVSANVNMQMA